MSDAKSYAIIKCYRQPFPKCRFIGVRYRNSDRVDGGFGEQWDQFHANDRFKPLEALLTDEFKSEYEDWDAYVALEKNGVNAPDEYYEYWIGMFVPENSAVPDGYGYVDLSYDNAGICWIKGTMDSVFCHEDECYYALQERRHDHFHPCRQRHVLLRALRLPALHYA